MFFNKWQHMRNNVIFAAGRQEHEADSCCFTGVPVIVVIIFILGREEHPVSLGEPLSPLRGSGTPLALLRVTLPCGQVFIQVWECWRSSLSSLVPCTIAAFPSQCKNPSSLLTGLQHPHTSSKVLLSPLGGDFVVYIFLFLFFIHAIALQSGHCTWIQSVKQLLPPSC